jgi:bacterioferritin (cytochrome b1)
MTNNILLDLYTSGITQVAIQSDEMKSKNFYLVYKITEKNIEWLSDKVSTLTHIGIPKGLSIHWFK